MNEPNQGTLYKLNLYSQVSAHSDVANLNFFIISTHMGVAGPAQVRNKAWFGICDAFAAFLESWTVIHTSLKHAAKMLKGHEERGDGQETEL